MRRLAGFVSSALAIAFLAGTAHAHHYIPRALNIEFAPNNSQRVVIGAADSALFASDDGGATWRLGCYAGLGAVSAIDKPFPLLVSTTGSVILQPGWSTRKSPDNFCSSEEAFVGGVVEGPLGGGLRRASDGTLFGLTGFGRENREAVTELWVSKASGESFSRSGDPLIGNFLGDSLLLAPNPAFSAALPPFVYVGGYLIDGDAGNEFAIARSGDLGVTWAVSSWLPERFHDGYVVRELLAVAPSNSVLMFARESRNGGSPDDQQAILFSPDSGVSWRMLHQGQHAVTGFAFSPDGNTLAIGDSIEGLFHVDVASLENDEPSITRVFEYPVWAITWNESGLYAGLNEFQPTTEPQFQTVGISHDGGRTFSPFMSLCDVNPSTCDASSDVSRCFDDFRETFQVASGRCPNIAPAGVGGGTGGSSAGGGGGGASSTGGASASRGGRPDGGGVSPGESTGGAAPQPNELRVTSCGMSSIRADPSPMRIGFFMLGAAAIALALRGRASSGIRTDT